MITRDVLSQFAQDPEAPCKADPNTDFDMNAYLARHSVEVIARKPWSSHPGGMIFEVARCPFNSDHRAVPPHSRWWTGRRGSAAGTTDAKAKR